MTSVARPADDDRFGAPADDASLPTVLIGLGALSVLCLAASVVIASTSTVQISARMSVALDVPPFGFAVLALLTARARARGPLRPVWALLAAAVLAWAAGNFIFDLRLADGDGSGRSIADLFHGLYYPPAMAALYLLARGGRRARLAGHPLDVVIVMVGAALLLSVLIDADVLPGTGVSATQALGTAYCALDLGVLWLLAFPVLRSDVVWTRTRALMGVAFLGVLVSDLCAIVGAVAVYDVIAWSSFALLGLVAAMRPNLADHDAAKRPPSHVFGDLAVVGAGAGAVVLLDLLLFRGVTRDGLAVGASVLLGLVLARLVLAVGLAERLHADAERRSSIDPLTGLLNHGAFHEQLERELSRARRGSEPLTVLLVDVDHLKDINDLAGHRAGDRALVQLADCLRAACRDADLVCRVGGDEMAIIAPGIGRDSAGRLASRLVQAGRTVRVDAGGHETHTSISVGSSTFPDDAGGEQELCDRADAALYAAKQAGRDRWTAFAPGSEEPPDACHQLDRMHAQLAARDSDFRAVFSHALEPMVITDGSTTILDVNDAAERMTAVPRESLVGRRLAEFVIPNGKTDLGDVLARIAATSRQRGRLPARLPSGRKVLIEYSASRFSRARYLVGLQDITAQAQADRELKESEARFRALFDSALDAIFITDGDGLILDVNPAATLLAGRSRPELLGTSIEVGALGSPDEGEPARASLRRDGRATGTRAIAGAHGVHRIVEYATVADFVPGQTLSIVRDISDRRDPPMAGTADRPDR